MARRSCALVMQLLTTLLFAGSARSAILRMPVIESRVTPHAIYVAPVSLAMSVPIGILPVAVLPAGVPALTQAPPLLSLDRPQATKAASMVTPQTMPLRGNSAEVAAESSLVRSVESSEINPWKAAELFDGQRGRGFGEGVRRASEWVVDKIAPGVLLRTQKSRLVRRTAVGTEVHELQVGGRKASVFIDHRTAAIVRGLKAGETVSIFGSQALEMLRPDGSIARKDMLDQTSDLDIIDDAPPIAMRKIQEMHPAGVDDVDPFIVRYEIMGHYSFSALALKLSRSESGGVKIGWWGPSLPLSIVRQAYDDFVGGVVRATAKGGMAPTTALVGLQYYARYPWMHFEAATEAGVSRVLTEWRRSGQARMERDLSHRRGDGWNRFEKVFRHAVDLERPIRWLHERGLYHGALKAVADRAREESQRVESE